MQKYSGLRFSIRGMLIAFVALGLVLAAVRHPRLWMSWSLMYAFIGCQMLSFAGLVVWKGRARVWCAAFAIASILWAPQGFSFQGDNQLPSPSGIFPLQPKGINDYTEGVGWFCRNYLQRISRAPITYGDAVFYKAPLEGTASTANDSLASGVGMAAWAMPAGGMGGGFEGGAISGFAGYEGTRIYQTFVNSVDSKGVNTPGGHIPFASIIQVTTLRRETEKLACALFAWLGVLATTQLLYAVLVRGPLAERSHAPSALIPS